MGAAGKFVRGSTRAFAFGASMTLSNISLPIDRTAAALRSSA
jgi:hypothetical protein